MDRFSATEKNPFLTVELELQGGNVSNPFDVSVRLTDITATGDIMY